MCLCGRKAAAFSWITFIIWSEKNGSEQTIELSDASKDRISQLMVSHTDRVQELRRQRHNNAGLLAEWQDVLVRLRVSKRIYILMIYLLRFAPGLRP